MFIGGARITSARQGMAGTGTDWFTGIATAVTGNEVMGSALERIGLVTSIAKEGH